MKTRTSLAIAVVAAAAAVACGPKADTANPDEAGGPTACTEEAMECPDGSTVSREGPDCEFPACPGEEEAAADDGEEAEPADGEGEPEGEPEADAEEAAE